MLSKCSVGSNSINSSLRDISKILVSKSPHLLTRGSTELDLFCSVRKFNTKQLGPQLTKESKTLHP